jgi:DNA polymerase III subunit alpha
MSEVAVSSRPFVHLRLHTEFSVTDSIVRIDEAVAQAAADDMPALAITDLGNLFGAVKFFQRSRGRGVQPIIGCEVTIENEKSRDHSTRLLLLCQNQAGYLNLCQLLTRGYRENMWRGHAEFKRSWFTPRTTDGLIALSGAAAGDVGQALLQSDSKRAIALANGWAQDFPGRYFLEIQRAGRDGDEDHVSAALNLASVTDLPVVATHPVQFMTAEDFKAHEARVCIARGEVMGDKRRSHDFSADQYFKSSAEMQALFADVPEALENAVEIAKCCHFAFSLGKSKLPNFPTPNGESIDQFLLDSARTGLNTRLDQLFPDAAKRSEVQAKYVSRLEFEVKTIVQMGFPGYFLIVADFIGWAKNNGVPVGPGRGSGAGSLVAYSLGITDLDPLQYDLLFERFLNPERVSMPDFDIDFCQEGRDRVIDYVKKKYGTESVSQIVTFGTMAAKAVIRDVGRVLGMGYNHVDGIAKLIPNQLGITLSDAIKQEPQFNERIKAEEEVAELIELALKLEGITRNVGMHAGGVLIAPGPLTEFTPLYVADGSDAFVSQYDKDDVEAVGLVKFDFLGLTTLTIINEAVSLIRSRGDGKTFAGFDLLRVPLDDAATYDVFARGSTAAIFQFESSGMRDLIKQAKPNSVEDLTALNALYRPGPMDLIPEYIRRKTGVEEVSYVDPRVEPILAPTYGVMVYQEQVMQIAQVVGAYSLGGADLLRRAMGKKKPEEMAKHRGIFAEGAVNNGIAKSVADELFDFMEKFAGYGFNKSHSAAYSLVAYHTAYLKAHFPAEFMAANMSCVMDFTDKVQLIADDARAIGLTLLAPDINHGTYRFYPTDQRTIRYGLGAVKGTGHNAIAAIVAARGDEKAGAPFRDLLDFVKRVDRSHVNRRAMEALIRAGAFDAIEPNRAALIATLPQAIELADKAERDALQVNLFGESSPEAGGSLELVPVPMWSDRDRLTQEKIALGFYLSGHPFASYAGEIRQFAKTLLADLQPKNESILMAGILYEQRVRNGKRGRMCVMTLDDGSARAEVVAYSDVFDKRRHLIRDDQPLIVRGRVSHDDFSGGNRVIADDVIDIEEARKFVRQLTLSMNGQADSDKLRRLLSPHLAPNQRDAVAVKILYNNGEAEVPVMLPDQWRVRVTEALVSSLTDWLSADNVAMVYDTTNMMPPPPPRGWRDNYQPSFSGAGEY